MVDSRRALAVMPHLSHTALSTITIHYHYPLPPMTPHLRASLPMFAPPAWAVLERALFDQLERAARVYLHKYTHRDGPRKGELIWRDELPGRDGADDFYEAFGVVAQRGSRGHGSSKLES